MGGVDLADEALNLAAAMQHAGYRRVVATLWPVGDRLARVAAAASTATCAPTASSGPTARPPPSTTSCSSCGAPTPTPRRGGRPSSTSGPEPRRHRSKVRAVVDEAFGPDAPLDVELRADALDVLRDVLEWRLVGPRWAAVEEALDGDDGGAAAAATSRRSAPRSTSWSSAARPGRSSSRGSQSSSRHLR